MPDEKLDSPKTSARISVPFAIALVIVAALIGAVAGITVQRVDARSGAEIEPAAEIAGVESDEPEEEPAPDAWRAEPVDDPFELLGPHDWDPFQEMQAMQERMDKIFNDSWMRLNRSPLRNFSAPGPRLTTAPSVDLTEHEDAYVVLVDMPGLEDGQANVTLEDGHLSISGSRVDVVKDTSGGQVIRQERRATQFARTIALPGPVDSDGMTTAYEDGVLTIRIPKQNAGDDSPGESSPQ